MKNLAGALLLGLGLMLGGCEEDVESAAVMCDPGTEGCSCHPDMATGCEQGLVCDEEADTCFVESTR